MFQHLRQYSCKAVIWCSVIRRTLRCLRYLQSYPTAPFGRVAHTSAPCGTSFLHHSACSRSVPLRAHTLHLLRWARLSGLISNLFVRTPFLSVLFSNAFISASVRSVLRVPLRLRTPLANPPPTPAHLHPAHILFKCFGFGKSKL